MGLGSSRKAWGASVAAGASSIEIKPPAIDLCDGLAMPGTAAVGLATRPDTELLSCVARFEARLCACVLLLIASVAAMNSDQPQLGLRGLSMIGSR